MAESPEAIGQTINLGTGQEISIGELANTILELIGTDVPVVQDSQRLRPENSEVDRLCAHNGKAQKLLNWQPQYTLQDGLTQTIEWMKRNIDQYRIGSYTI